MIPQNTDQFYADLPVYQMTFSQLFAHREYFREVPKDWHVIITDVQNSTQAVMNGLQQTINLVASGSIIAVLNIGRTEGITIPFFYGGDGATLLVPPSILDRSMQALSEHRKNTIRNFQLQLRVGQVPVVEVYEHDCEIRLAKMYFGKKFAIPVVLGRGLKFVETTVKARHIDLDNEEQENSTLNLEGMECRWNLIKPPKNSSEVVCLLIDARDPKKQAAVFAEVLDTIDTLYGSPVERNPISVAKLKLEATPSRIFEEMQVKLGRFSLSYFLQNFLYTFFGFVYFRLNSSGKEYLQQLVELSETLVLDGRINTVISGTSQQRILLQQALEKMEEEDKIVFGLHLSQESIMSCYVRNREDEHIHFVDGSQGGYTQAAKMLKQKLHRL